MYIAWLGGLTIATNGQLYLWLHKRTMFGPVMIVRLQLEEAYWRGGGKGAGHVRGGKVNASHYDVCTTLLGTGWPYVILSSIGWRPALIQRVSRENSGQTELEERERERERERQRETERASYAIQ